MTNKDRYIQAMGSIQVDPALSESTLRQMRAAKAKKPAFGSSPFWKIALAGACCLAVGVALWAVLRVIKPAAELVQGTDASTSASASGVGSTPDAEESKLPETVITLPPATLSKAPMHVAADTLSDGCVAQDSSFTLTWDSPEDIPEAVEIAKCISVTPKVEFTVETNEQGQAVLIPAQPLEESSILQVVYTAPDSGDEFRYAFQVAPELKVVSTLPADATSFVECSSGIEIAFSRSGVTEAEFRRCFSIQPETAGEVLVNGSTLVFQPREPLSANTQYTVSLDGSLALDGDTLGTPVSFSFTTASYAPDGSEPYLSAGAQMYESFDLSTAPVIAAFSNLENPAGKITVFACSGPEEYASLLGGYLTVLNGSMGEYKAYAPDVSGLREAFSFDTVLARTADDSRSDFDYLKFAVLPEPLEEGYYVLRLTLDPSADGGRGLTLYKFIQSTDLTLARTSLGDQTVFWINDCASEQPVSGAEITVTGSGLSGAGVTDENGVLSLSGLTGKDAALCGLVTVKDGDRTFVDVFRTTPAADAPDCAGYASYLYSDRPVYKETDTVSFWGVLRPYSGVAAYPEDLIVTLGNYAESPEQAFYTVPVTVGTDGTFRGELSYEALNQSWGCFLTLWTGETRLYSRYLSLYNYEKPEYTLEVELDSPVIFAGDDLTGAVTATFFDGTPAAGLELLLTYGDSTLDITADESGRGEFTLPTSRSMLYNGDDWQPEYWTLHIQNRNAEQTGISVDAETRVLSADVALRMKYDGDTSVVTVLTDKMDPTRVVSLDDMDYADVYSALFSGAYDTAVSATLYQVFYTQTETGSYYDFINKRTVAVYDYQRDEREVQNWQLNTVNGQAVLELPELKDGSGYYVRLQYQDQTGHPVSIDRYLWEYWPSNLTSQHNYTLERANGQNSYDTTFSEDKNLAFLVKDNGVAVSGGKVLLAAVQKDICWYGVSDALGAIIPYDDSLIPNFVLYALYFDGEYVHPLPFSSYADSGYDQGMYGYLPSDYSYLGRNMTFDPSTRVLEVAVTSDKTEYGPGDTVTLSVALSRSDPDADNTGTVLLSVVDEAVFEVVRDEDYDVLASLYASKWEPDVDVAVSHRDYTLLYTDGGGSGSGGDANARVDFKDTAQFITLRTDASGRGSVTFTLPDNLTTWRVTAMAVSDDLFAGYSTSPITARQDFFLTAIAAPQLLTGDSLGVTFRGWGRDSAGKDVSYNAALYPADAVLPETVNAEDLTDGKDAEGQEIPMPQALNTLSAEGVAGTYTTLSMGELSAGEYRLLLTASCDGDTDAVILPVRVVEHAVTLPITAELPLEEVSALKPTEYPVELLIYDERTRLTADILSSALAGAGSRTDVALAETKANALLSDTLLTAADFSWNNLLDDNGLVKLFSYAEGDARLTALSILSCPELVGLRAYDKTALLAGELTSSQLADRYLLLAVNGQPVLSEIKTLLEKPEGLTRGDLLQLSTACAILGDTEYAKDRFEQYVRTQLTSESTPKGRVVAYLAPGGEDTESAQMLTARAAVFASVLGMPESEALTGWLYENPSDTDLTLLEQMVFVRLHKADCEGSFTLNTGAEPEKATLPENGQPLHRSLSKAQFEALTFSDVKGQLRAQVVYRGSYADASAAQSADLTVEKSLPEEVRMGSVVTVSVSMDGAALSKDGSYCVTLYDTLPSNTRFMGLTDRSAEYSDAGCWYVKEKDGQNITLVYWGTDAPTEVSYTIMCVSEGTAVSDSAFVLDEYSRQYGISERGQLTGTPAK